MAPIVYATGRPLRPLTNYPSPAAEEGGARGPGAVRGRRKSIAGSEYIQRRSAVRVWKFETAFLARVLSETPGGNPHATTICPQGEEERAGGGKMRGEGLQRTDSAVDDLARVIVTSVLRLPPFEIRFRAPCRCRTITH